LIQSFPSDRGAGHGAGTETILEALPGDRVVQSNALATVTTNCLIIRSSEQHLQTIIPIVHLSRIKTAKTTYPGLLVIGAACLLISAAAYSSSQEGGAALPAGILGIFFVIVYLAHRRVAVSFVTRSDETVTSDGSTGEAAALIEDVRSVQAKTSTNDFPSDVS
jgi:hypothetical protein